MKNNVSQVVYCTYIMVILIVVTFFVLLAMPRSFTGWDDDSINLCAFIRKWKKNVKQKPEWDTNKWIFNYIAHPYCGAIYYMIPKSNNFSNGNSFVYSVFVSTVLWEYGVEAFAEIPSIQDLIITPIGGYFVGKKFNRMTKKIISNNKKLMNSKKMGKLAIFLMNPINIIAKRIKSKKK